jgi:hypothetical protein
MNLQEPFMKNQVCSLLMTCLAFWMLVLKTRDSPFETHHSFCEQSISSVVCHPSPVAPDRHEGVERQESHEAARAPDALVGGTWVQVLSTYYSYLYATRTTINLYISNSLFISSLGSPLE